MYLYLKSEKIYQGKTELVFNVCYISKKPNQIAYICLNKIHRKTSDFRIIIGDKIAKLGNGIIKR